MEAAMKIEHLGEAELNQGPRGACAIGAAVAISNDVFLSPLFQRVRLRFDLAYRHIACIENMPGVVQLLAAQIDDEGTLIHQPHSLRGAQCREGLKPCSKLEGGHRNCAEQLRARKIRMMAKIL